MIQVLVAQYIKTISIGDIIEIRNESGEIICGYSYDSFGNNELYDYTNSQSNIYDRKFVELNPFRYRGYYYDQESELYYLINRYYDPETHRFLTIDSFEYLDIESISGIDLYQYCNNNNPVMYVDEGGNFPVQIEILASAITDFANLLSFGFKKHLNICQNYLWK
ncbi:RHS repeat-associated core domain-containing protein [bacterium]|nr:RHS repeat-associated core domain-containing protein [bacterium]